LSWFVLWVWNAFGGECSGDVSKVPREQMPRFP
jgi:hypothetical protein